MKAKVPNFPFPENTYDLKELIARAIHEVFDDGSVTSMFDGAA